MSDDPAVKPADLVGQPVGWTVNDPDDSPRQFHGLVRSWRAGPTIGRGLREYRAEVVPWLWFLTRTLDCKIFQNKSAPDIITAVCDGYGFGDYDLQLTGPHPVREYCVQYRESAFAFVSRLMEDEGIFTTHTFAAGKHTLVLADAPAAYVACAPQDTAEYRPEARDVAAVTAWERGATSVAGRAASTDYDFTAPATKLLATTDTVAPLAGVARFELFDFPGHYTAADRGAALVKLRMEEEEALFDTAAGAGGCSAFRPGGTFTLTGHPADDGEYVVVGVGHAASDPHIPGVRGGTATYANTFTCAPAAVPVRPARATPKPRAAGPQTAVVVGPAGEEVHTDEYGRV